MVLHGGSKRGTIVHQVNVPVLMATAVRYEAMEPATGASLAAFGSELQTRVACQAPHQCLRTSHQ
eukprot:7902391-Lingulodinium_polyedra.AAC.1